LLAHRQFSQIPHDKSTISHPLDGIADLLSGQQHRDLLARAPRPAFLAEVVGSYTSQGAYGVTHAQLARARVTPLESFVQLKDALLGEIFGEDPVGTQSDRTSIDRVVVGQDKLIEYLSLGHGN
jgi:hypothetical protein